MFVTKPDDSALYAQLRNVASNSYSCSVIYKCYADLVLVDNNEQQCEYLKKACKVLMNFGAANIDECAKILFDHRSVLDAVADKFIARAN